MWAGFLATLKIVWTFNLKGNYFSGLKVIIKLSALALGLILCVNFISCMDGKTECALSNFIYDTSSGTVFGMSNVSTSIQRDLKTLEDKARVQIQKISVL